MPTITANHRWIVPLACVVILAACSQSQPADTKAPPAAATIAAPASVIPPPGASAPQPVKSKVATFDGTLPCADCSGIQTHLVLQRDEIGRNSYVLRETYQGKSAQPFLSAGRWTLSVGASDDAQAALVHLDSGRPADSKIWRIGGDRSLTLVDSHGMPAKSQLNYTIKRAGGDLDLHALYAKLLTKQPAAPGSD